MHHFGRAKEKVGTSKKDFSVTLRGTLLLLVSWKNTRTGARPAQER
jgi:hypothetical protein